MAGMCFAMMILMLVGTSVPADTEIHHCLLEDGTIAFQETPCSEPAANADDSSDAGERRSDRGRPAADSNVLDFVSPFDETASPPTPLVPTLPALPSKERAECEKITRDAIDAIDLDIKKNAYSKTQGQEYHAELL